MIPSTVLAAVAAGWDKALGTPAAKQERLPGSTSEPTAAASGWERALALSDYEKGLPLTEAEFR